MIKLSAADVALYRQCINEVLRGFHDANMEKSAGVSYALLMKEDAAFSALARAGTEVDSSNPATPLRPQVISEAIRQLGRDEFHTRTGRSLEDGYALLKKVKEGS